MENLKTVVNGSTRVLQDLEALLSRMYINDTLFHFRAIRPMLLSYIGYRFDSANESLQDMRL